MLYKNLHQWGSSVFENLWAVIIVLIIVLLLEKYYQGDDNSFNVLRRAKGRSFDIFSFFISSLRVHHIVIDLVFLGLLVKLKNYTHFHSLNFYVADGLMGTLLYGLMGILLFDQLIYWNHRLKHKLPPLWFSHRFHHSTTDLNALSFIRFHSLDKPWRAISVTAPFLFIVGPTFANLLWVYLLDITVGIISHSRLNTDFGILGKIFVSPRFHRRHHALEDSNCNFGLIFSFTDKIYGTYKDESLAFSTPTGTLQMSDSQNVLKAYVSVYINLAKWLISPFVKK